MPRFVPRERKHKRLARQANGPSNDVTNSNPEEILPVSHSEKEARREALKQQFRDQQPESKLTSKKRRRLDKYIDTKLKKDENVELLRKLADQQVDTSLLRSSRKLGRVQESKRERLQRALKERDALGVEGSSVLYEPRRDVADWKGNETSSDDSSASEADEHPARTDPNTDAGEAVFGSGLKRPLDLDERGEVVLRKRKRRKGNDIRPFSGNGVGVSSPSEVDHFSEDGEQGEE